MEHDISCTVFGDPNATPAEVYEKLYVLLESPNHGTLRSVQAELEKNYSTDKLRRFLKHSESKYVARYFDEVYAVLDRDLACINVDYRPRDRNDVMWMMDVDHYQPESRGGPNAASNYALVPSLVNNKLSDEEPTEESRKSIVYGARDEQPASAPSSALGVHPPAAR